MDELDCDETSNGLATVMSSRPVKEVRFNLTFEEGGNDKSELEEEEVEVWQVQKIGWSLADAIAPHWFMPPSGT